jgi:DNA-directed RNA polymerase subunit M/transcription elongation factor TFIIS
MCIGRQVPEGGVMEHMYEDPPESMHRRRLETVVAQRPRCPRCGGVRLRKYRSQRDQGDGSSLSWVRCLDEQCGHRFRLVLE